MQTAYATNFVGISEIEGRKPFVRNGAEPSQKDEKLAEVGLAFSLELPATGADTSPSGEKNAAESCRSSVPNESLDATVESLRPENAKSGKQVEPEVVNQGDAIGELKASKVASSLSVSSTVAGSSPMLVHSEARNFVSKPGDVSDETVPKESLLQNPSPTEVTPADRPSQNTNEMPLEIPAAEVTLRSAKEAKPPLLESRSKVRVESRKMPTDGHENFAREISDDAFKSLMDQTSKITTQTSYQSISTAVFFPTDLAAPDKQLPDTSFDPVSLTGLSEFSREQLPPLGTRTIATEPSAELPRSVAVQIAKVARSGADKPIELTLNPEELGRLKMTFQTEASSLNIILQVERPETQELIRRHINLLAQEMQDLGYAEITFSFQQQGEAPNNQSQPESSEPLDDPRITTSGMPDQKVIQIAIGQASGVDIRI